MPKNKKTIPILKEHRIKKLEKSLECIDKYAFKRLKQRDCVLKEYPDKGKGLEHMDKSIFRGMVLPSLRKLGLIIGQGQFIRASANGKLIIESQHLDKELHERVKRLIIYEVDKQSFSFIDALTNFWSNNLEQFEDELCSRIEQPAKKQREERVKHWLSILNEVGLINCHLDNIVIDDKNLRQTIDDSDVSHKNRSAFRRHFFSTYFELSKDSAGIVDIAELRERVAIKLLTEHELIISERQFDEMLRMGILKTDEYVISLGRPMGARDKLFEYEGKYYRTIFMKPKKRDKK